MKTTTFNLFCFQMLKEKYIKDFNELGGYKIYKTS